MAGRPYILAETNWKTVKATDYEVAVLPWGATEAHNYHLPYSTDVVQCDEIAAEAARIAWEREAKVVVLPTVPFGVNTGQLDIKLDLNLNPSTQLAILGDLVEALKAYEASVLHFPDAARAAQVRLHIQQLRERTPPRRGPG